MKVKVIEAKKPEKKKIRVAAYARVSTDHDEQENSLDNQISYYRDYISSNPEYEYVNVYYDFGISGFKEKRPGFQKMMTDARAGLIDLIITKSITRFARNTDTVLKATRELKEIGIGVFFELQSINSLTAAGELLMTIYAAFGQAEIDSMSVLEKMAYKRRCDEGRYQKLIYQSFGYTKDENGNIVPDENAKWVKKIYKLRAEGYDTGQISRYMEKKGVRTSRGAKLTASKVWSILHDVIYTGDYMTRRHFSTEDHRQLKNRGEVPSIYIKNDHPRIVSDRLWNKVQELNEKGSPNNDKSYEAKEKNEMNYPYMNKLYCGICGHRLVRSIAYGKYVSWICNGSKNYTTKFCSGVRVPDCVVRSWGGIKGNIFITQHVDELGKITFSHYTESTWRRTHSVKPTPRMPELTKERYPFLGKVFCKKCGSALIRKRNPSGSISWMCNGYLSKGRGFCEGITIPNDVLMKVGTPDQNIYIGKEIIDGEERYGYTSEPDDDKLGKLKNRKKD